MPSHTMPTGIDLASHRDKRLGLDFLKTKFGFRTDSLLSFLEMQASWQVTDLWVSSLTIAMLSLACAMLTHAGVESPTPEILATAGILTMIISLFRSITLLQNTKIAIRMLKGEVVDCSHDQKAAAKAILKAEIGLLAHHREVQHMLNQI